MNRDQLFYDVMMSPIGEICVITDGHAIIRIDFGTLEYVKVKAANWFNRYFEKPLFTKGHQRLDQAIKELEEYFTNERKQFSISYQLFGTAFQQSVWEATTRAIPYGETKSYKQIGEVIENPKAVRAIGGALNKNPCSIVVPCHRVIGSSGKMVGYGGGLDKKNYLLHFEQK